jgi:hypothetical protein
MVSELASHVKLPTYRPPAVARVRTPSPPPKLVTPNNAIIAAIGCEVIIHDIVPAQGHTSHTQLQVVINQVTMESPDFSMFPVKVEGSCAKETLSTCCYI